MGTDANIITDFDNKKAFRVVEVTGVVNHPNEGSYVVDVDGKKALAVVVLDGGGGSGDMTKAVYDPSAINEQLVGLTASQTLTNKTIDADNSTITNIGAAEIKADIITGQSLVVALAGDQVLITDASDTDALKRVNVSDFLGGGGITIGDPVGSSINNAILFVDGSGNLANDSDLTFDGTNFNVDSGHVDTLNGYFINGTHALSIDSGNVVLSDVNSLTSGINNVFIGVNAAHSALTTSQSVVIGQDACGGATGIPGLSTVAVGFKALFGITAVAQFNVAVGYLALQSMTTGDDTVGIGRDSGNRNNGSRCVFIGNNTGDGNAGVQAHLDVIAIGNNTLNWLSADSPSYAETIAIGREALKNRGTTTRTIAIGTEAGYNSGGTSGFDSANSIFLGYRAGKLEEDDYKYHLAMVDGKSLNEGFFDNSGDADWFKIIGVTKRFGGVIEKEREVADADSTITTEDNIISYTSISTPRTSTLPTPTMDTDEVQMWVIKDKGAGFNANNLTIATPGSETIDGSASLVLSVDDQSVKIGWDGTNYFTYS